MAQQRIERAADGLPAILQGPWSRDKLHFVSYFASLFNGGMKNRWAVRAYVDLFSGPGICVDRNSGEEFQGSPLQALGCRTPFTHYFFNDGDAGYIEALRRRQERLFPEAVAKYYKLDCNAAASRIGNDLPERALTLAFIDPWSYEITFDAIASLVTSRATDLIVTFHSTAIKRNANRAIAAVDKFLDDPTWRERYWSAQGDPSNPRTFVLIDTFIGRLKTRLGYRHFGEPEVIRNTNGSPIFYVLFASRNSRGLDFWEKSSARLPSGQRTLF